MKLFVQYKNSEINTYHKTISQYKDYFKNHKINPGFNKQNNAGVNDNSNNNKNNNNVDYGTIMVEMSSKDNLIKSLNSKLDKYMNEYKDIIGEKQMIQQKLKLRIKEILGNNRESNLLKQQKNNNYIKNQNFNNFLDIKQIPLTPTQKKKFSGMSHGNMKLKTMQEKGPNFGTNDFYYKGKKI